MKENRSVIVISISSDIGIALAQRWLKRGWEIFGTYKTVSPAVKELEKEGVNLVYCDISDSLSVHKASNKLKKLCPAWDILVMCPASLEPVGSFAEVVFDEWENSVELNFTSQMLMVQELLPSRRKDSVPGPCILFFSGGGINDAPTNYSAYTISKIATIKMCEVLDAEIPDTRFVTIGPGWVKTKIHQQTLKAGLKAGSNYQCTLKKFKTGDFTPMESVLDCCDWVVNGPKEVVSGRNFSVVHDKWGSKELSKKLVRESDLLKLRKYGSIKK